MADQAVFEYAGVPLLFDMNRQAQQFLDRYLPIEQLVTPPDNPARDDWHCNTAGQGRVGLPRPNYPPPPRPQINTLYWPTGATRWARGWFLCDQEGVDKLTDLGYSDAPWGTFVRAKALRISTPSEFGDDDDQYTLAAQMFLLRPLQITATNSAPFGDLWLVPLVDSRYFWQWAPMQFYLGTSSIRKTWEDLISDLGESLKTDIEYDAIHSEYMLPDPIESLREYDNAAMLLDAVAHSIGRRVVVDFSGNTSLQTYTQASSAIKTSHDHIKYWGTAGQALIAGRTTRNTAPPAWPWPEKIRVSFPAMDVASNDGAQYHYRKDTRADEVDGIIEVDTPITRGTKTVQCRAWAMFQCGGDGAYPANRTNLDALATRFSTDSYGWLKHQYDHAWPGVQRWTPCGFDDHVLFELGTEYVEDIEAIADHDGATPDLVTVRENLGRRYMTRVQSMPANFGVSSILCQYEHAIPGVADGLMVKTPSGGIAARDCYDLSSACCKVYHADPAGDGTATLDPVYCDDSNTHWQIRVYNIANAAVSGDALVLTDVLKNGLRVVTVESCATDSCPESSSSS